MTEIPWDDKYLIGVLEMDLQHKNFISLLNKCYSENHERSPLVYKLRLIDELTKYAHYHFTSEENIMYYYGYPRMKQHELEHQMLLNELQTKVKKLINVTTEWRDICRFISLWFVAHTTEEDQQFGKYVIEQKAKLNYSIRAQKGFV